MNNAMAILSAKCLKWPPIVTFILMSKPSLQVSKSSMSISSDHTIPDILVRTGTMAGQAGMIPPSWHSCPVETDREK